MQVWAASGRPRVQRTTVKPTELAPAASRPTSHSGRVGASMPCKGNSAASIQPDERNRSRTALPTSASTKCPSSSCGNPTSERRTHNPAIGSVKTRTTMNAPSIRSPLSFTGGRSGTPSAMSMSSTSQGRLVIPRCARTTESDCFRIHSLLALTVDSITPQPHFAT